MSKTQKKDNKSLVDRLERTLQVEEERMKHESDPGKRQTAARTVIMFISELRKARKDEARNADDLTEARVIEWYRRLSDSAAEGFMRALTLSRKKGSGLA